MPGKNCISYITNGINVRNKSLSPIVINFIITNTAYKNSLVNKEHSVFMLKNYLRFIYKIVLK